LINFSLVTPFFLPQFLAKQEAESSKESKHKYLVA